MLRIYKASAGSGKTYTLVKEYLRLAFAQPDKFKHILAITFTNKAAAEMKNRILEALEGIAHGTEKYEPLAAELSDLCNKREEILRAEAAMLLRNMLHNYADISISTIDSFVHRIVRSFAYDLHLPMNFDIEMDSTKLLNEAVELLLDNLNEADAQVTQAVIDFAESKIEDGKSWNVEMEIAKLGRELFNDEALPHIGQLSFVSFDALREARSALHARRNSFEQSLFEEGKKAYARITSSGLTTKDFHQGARGLFGFFSKYAEGEFPKEVKGNSYVLATIEEDKWSKNSAITEGVKAELVQHYLNIVSLWDKHGKEYYLADLLLKNFYSFILLADLQKLMESIKQDGNILHISDFQHKVYEIVKEQDAPVIYERIGDRYDSILIDEFQDTSVMQWRNLLPLIENSQFKNEDSLIVGDGKQAIYRFRGGEVEQFSVLPKVFGSGESEVLKGREIAIGNYGAEVIPLEKNFRSRKEVIDFNNALYKELLEVPELKNKAIYSDYHQLQGRKDDGGFVSIEFLDNNAEREEETAINDLRCQRVEEIVKDVLQRGYSFRDVAVLTRSNSNASVIASYLVQQGIRVISPESLLIHHSPKVRLLLSVLNYLEKKENHIARAEIFHYVFLLRGIEVRYETLDLDVTSKQFEEKLRAQTDVPFDSFELPAGRLSDLMHELMRLFGLDEDDPFVQFFLDEVLLFASRYGNNIYEFLQWWERVKDKKSIIYPESMNAVRIMTIHKSKGLQFPVVILADAAEQKKLTKKFFWVGLQKNWLPQLNIGLLPVTSAVKETEFAPLYEREDEQSFLDMLNLFYVGTTRAEDALYILSNELKNLPKENNSVTALLITYLTSIGKWEGFQPYTFGDAAYRKIVGKEKKQAFGSYIKEETKSKNLLASAIKVKVKAEALWSDEANAKVDKGRLLHQALKQIRYTGDEVKVAKALVADGSLLETEQEEFLVLLQSVIHHPQLNEYFLKDVTVVNERALLQKGEKMRIPDRVVFANDSAVVIDYKTGNERTEYKQQVNEYAALLQQAGISVSRKILFYTQTQKAEVWV